MTILAMIAAAVVFFALILASIALHEVGHMLPAKKFGVRVPQYFVGFGKTIWSKKVGETEYGLKLIPLGGYVRLVGMYPPEAKRGTGRLATIANDAREAEWETITAADVRDQRLFYQKKSWQKLIVMAGGPLMNILLAYGVFLGINQLYGQQQPTLQVQKVVACVDEGSSTCVESPAKAAGAQPGDTIVAFNGQPVSRWPELVSRVRANGRGTVQLTVDRDGQRVELPAVPGVVRAVPALDDPTKTVEAGFVGVKPGSALVRVGPVDTAVEMWNLTRQSLVALATFPGKVVTTGYDLVTGRPRDVNGPLSVVGASRVAGEIATTEQLTWQSRTASYFSLLAGVNLFVALLNLVPLLPFDGGHIAGALWEALRRAVSRLLRRPDPGYVDTARLLPVAYVVGGFLLLAGAVLIVADIISPIKIF
ncbi:MAG: M50 family metallopeptidase [Actinomycetia bacterium]|nr:M50 family metallopeptidase [Actinomycetes bacterium]